MIRISCGGPNAFYQKTTTMKKLLIGYKNVHRLMNMIKIIMEIHNNSLIETADSALRLLDMIDRNVGLIHDAGNMYIDTDYDMKPLRDW